MAAPLVHIGYPKCMSTSLQSYMSTHSAYRSMCPGSNRAKDGDYAVVEALWEFLFGSSGNARPDPRLGEYCSNSERPVVISNEGISVGQFNQDPNVVLERIGSIVPNARILIIVRNQIDLLESLYRQFVYMGWKLPHIEDWIYDNRDTVLKRLKYDAVINAYAQKFGRHNIFVCFFEELKSDHATASVSTLAEFFGISVPEVWALLRIHRTNITGSRGSIGKRDIKRLYQVMINRESDIFKRSLRRLQKALRAEERNHLSADARRWCAYYFSASNAQLRKLVGSLPTSYV